MQPTMKLWRWLGVVFVLSFAALGWLGREIYLAAPPIPAAVQIAGGETLFTADDIEIGQGVWRSTGGQQLGSVWGHGSYVAPDWSADWLHREAVALRDELAQRDHRKAYDALTPAERAATLDAMKVEMRRNTYDPATKTVAVSAERARAIERVAAHYAGVFGNDPAFAKLREQYAMMDDTLPGAEDKHKLAAFFFWSAWSASHRPSRRSGAFLHQQLAARAARRQHAADVRGHLVDREHRAADRRHRRAWSGGTAARRRRPTRPPRRPTR